MLKRLTRKIFILFVLVAALAVASSAPNAANAGGVFCVDAPLESGCFGWICCNEWGGCWCVS